MDQSGPGSNSNEGYTTQGGMLSVIVIMVGNGVDDPILNSQCGCLHYK